MFAKKSDSTIEDKKKESGTESLAGIASVFVCGLFIITFVVQAFEIPSGSMENTLLVGDHVFVDRLSPTIKAGYLGPLMPYRDIKRGDIIVFLHPSEPGMYVVKRVMGIPGDRIHLKNGVVYRNGEELHEPYLLRQGTFDEYRENFPQGRAFGANPEWPLVMRNHLQDGDLVVPPDNYFGMGDHRDVSLDSRYWGFIPRRNIIGRPVFIYWSFDTPARQYERTDVGDRVGFFFHVVTHFLGETRWRRMFHLVH